MEKETFLTLVSDVARSQSDKEVRMLCTTVAEEGVDDARPEDVLHEFIILATIARKKRTKTQLVLALIAISEGSRK